MQRDLSVTAIRATTPLARLPHGRLELIVYMQEHQRKTGEDLLRYWCPPDNHRVALQQKKSVKAWGWVASSEICPRMTDGLAE